MSDKADWLADLKVGDLVWVRWGSGKGAGLQQVARFTKTQIVIDDRAWFRRVDGRKPARCDCCWHQIEEPTAAQARKARR